MQNVLYLNQKKKENMWEDFFESNWIFQDIQDEIWGVLSSPNISLLDKKEEKGKEEVEERDALLHQNVFLYMWPMKKMTGVVGASWYQLASH